jgi:phosphoribosylformylglycinamidine cyclo-ligase
MQAGDVLIGVASSGVHSNGYSLVRAIVRQRRLKLDRPYDEIEDPRPLGEVLLTPTRIYARPVVAVLRHYRVKKVITGMAHITGGGLPGNLPRALPQHLSARIDRKSWSVPPLFGFLQDGGHIEEAEMWRVFNMGVGYVMIVRPSFADSIVRQLTRHGEAAWVMGEIVQGDGSLIVD